MKSQYESTKVIELGSCAFRQWRATHSHCRFLHGYQLIAKFWFGGSSLDEKNWVVDFGGLKALKKELNDMFDHTTCVAGDDPEIETFRELDRKGLIQLRVFNKGVGIERTAEVVFDIAQQFIGSLTSGRCWVEKVEVFEHEDNSATYSKLNWTENLETAEGNDYTEADIRLLNQPIVNTSISDQHTITASNSYPAPITNVVSNGKGGWFEGTTWG